MTEFNASDRDVSRAIRSWLHEDRHEDVSRVAAAVLDQVEATSRRRATWWPARRTPLMSKILTVGLGTAAVVVALIVGTQFLGSPNGGVGTGPTPTAIPSPTPDPTPSLSAEAGLPEGPFLISDGDATITVQITTPGWMSLPEFEAVSKGDDDRDAPEGTSAALLAWSTADGILVYGDPCNWSTTIPETPATTPDEIAAALAAQPSRDASEPVDVTVGGYAGKHVTLHVAIDAPTREAAFADCDEETFGSYTYEGQTQPARYHQGPAQIDELWILDVDGDIVILDAMYGPATPPELVDDIRALAESATFD